MTRHFSEADLLETYYLPPGDSMPVMMHLADCSDCAARYERLETKLRETASCHSDHPETFWTRQRVSIMRRVAATNGTTGAFARIGRVAAAAVLSFTLGGLMAYKVATRNNDTKSTAPVAAAPAAMTPTASAAAAPDTPAMHDPWDSEDLEGFHSVVAWETWVDSDNGGRL